LESKKVLPADEVQKIIKDVYNALCDIYSEGYVHRNIRPEHIVLVSGETKEKDQWKIDTLVLDN
jgi:serine/threonine protein kinase